jgi:hypothetical protein
MAEDVEILYSLKRELPTHELIGRKFFRDLNKWFSSISLADDTPHEQQYWGAYTVVTPVLIDTNELSDNSISISSFSNKDKHYLVLSFKEQDPNNTDLPVKSRTLLQNILTQLKAKDEH